MLNKSFLKNVKMGRENLDPFSFSGKPELIIFYLNNIGTEEVFE